MSEESRIPNKGEEFVNEWLARIKPVTKVNGVLYHCKCDAHPYNQAFTWMMTSTSEASDLEEVCKIPTLHLYGYYGFFKPSLAEVIQQIPVDLLYEVDYFHCQGPTLDEMAKNEALFNEGYQVAETTLYRRRREAE